MPIMLDMFSAVAGSSVIRRSRVGGIRRIQLMQNGKCTR
jgi:hypothetical protein